MNRASSRTHLFASSDREREPPPDPRRSLTERFRPELLSAYIATADEGGGGGEGLGARSRVSSARRGGGAVETGEAIDLK